jgi:hypothetical protein
MNRRPSGSLLLSRAISGFLQYKAAEGLSPSTLQSYQRDLKLWQICAGGTSPFIIQFTPGYPLTYLRTFPPAV